MHSLINQLVDEGISIDMELWIEGVEDTANRVGLLFCDSLKVARDRLHDESTMSSRSADERVHSLIKWALSDSFTTMRRRMGLSI